jgi:hypothetical protein
MLNCSAFKLIAAPKHVLDPIRAAFIPPPLLEGLLQACSEHLIDATVEPDEVPARTERQPIEV